MSNGAGNQIPDRPLMIGDVITLTEVQASLLKETKEQFDIADFGVFQAQKRAKAAITTLFKEARALFPELDGYEFSIQLQQGHPRLLVGLPSEPKVVEVADAGPTG